MTHWCTIDRCRHNNKESNMKMLKKSSLSLTVASTLGLGMVGMIQPVFAQESEPLQEVEEFVVTGSRLNTNPNLSAPIPVISVGEQELENRGTVRIEDLVNILPQAFAGQTGEVSNGASGTSSLNLRGLGAERTLTLINGRRLPFGSSQFAPVNADLIPSSLVERFDITTGGASAVYGSDAIAGVANFVLKTDFEGLEIDVQADVSQNDNSSSLFTDVLAAGGQEIPGSSTDGETELVSITWGTNFAEGRGNVTLFGSFEQQDAIVQADRTFSACTLGGSTDPVTSVGGFGCVGSGNFRLFGGPGGSAFQEENGEIVEFIGGPSQTFNFGAANFFQRPNERLSLYASSNYELNDYVEFYSSASYIENESDAQIAPTASFGTGAFSINCDNPFIQDGGGDGASGIPLTDIFGCTSPTEVVSGITASHRNVEGGPRNSFLENSTLRLESGIRGKFGDIWSYDVFSLFATTEDTSTATEDFVVSQLQQAFFATTDASGNVVCVDQSNGCVPFNIFQRGPNGESLVTQEALDFIQGDGVVEGETEQISFGGTVQADLGAYGIASPAANDAGIGILFGFEYREDSLASFPDAISQIPGGGFTGVGGATLPVSGEVEVAELYFEGQIPLITDRVGAKELTVNAQYRFSDYSTDGNGISNSFDTDTFGLAINWTPVDAVKFRGQFQRAVRAPNVIELFTGQDQGLPNLNVAGINALGVEVFDPCATSAPLLSLEQCALTGVTAEQFGTILDVISGQTQSITGGNPLLDPESSDTTTVGVVISPAAVPNFSLSIDLFDIEIEELINDGVPAQITLDNCLAGDQVFCDLIQRAPTGSLAAGGPGFGITQTNLNIAELATRGVDVQFRYSFDTDRAGRFSFEYAGTFVQDFDFTPFSGGDPVECAGNFGNACFFDVVPEYRHRAFVTWDSPWLFDATLTWRHTGGVDNVSETAPDIDASLDAVNYFDLSVNFAIGDAISIRTGVINAFNEDPPVSISGGPPQGNGNTFPSIFDTGRRAFVGFNYNFN